MAELQARVGARHASADAATRTFLNPNTYSRYLWAHGFKLEKAEENLEATIAWRKTFIHPKLHCEACVEDSQSHCFLRLGHDRWARPIVYFCPGRNKCTDSDMMARHTISEMEAAFAKADSAENWVFIMDLRGFSVFGSATQSAKDMAGLFTAHYPERLGVMICLDMGMMVEMAFGAVKLFMDPVTVRKVNMVRSKDMPAIADALCGADRPTADWVLAAIGIENKPGTALPPPPPAAPTAVHTLIARGLTLEEVIAREASTKVGVATPPLPPAGAAGAAGGAAGGAGAAVAIAAGLA